MRERYKEQAEKNIIASRRLLGHDYEVTWKLVQIVNTAIQKCLQLDEVANDVKAMSLLVMLHNSISDICCCLDSLERGHERTVLNNLRMIFEDLCCAIHMHHDHSVYERFLREDHSASASVGHAKKLRADDEWFGTVYGELSKVAHHIGVKFLASQMVTREGMLSHLKPIDANKLTNQTVPLLLVVYLTRLIGEFSEETCLQYLNDLYFWLGKERKNKYTEIDILIQPLLAKASLSMKEAAPTRTKRLNSTAISNCFYAIFPKMASFILDTTP